MDTDSREKFRSAQKRKLLGDFYTQYRDVHIFLDATHADVSLPRHLKDSNIVTLKISSYFNLADAFFGPDYMTVSLKFSGQYFLCTIPYPAIWGIAGDDQKEQVWSADMPKEVRAQYRDFQSEAAETPENSMDSGLTPSERRRNIGLVVQKKD